MTINPDGTITILAYNHIIPYESQYGMAKGQVFDVGSIITIISKFKAAGYSAAVKIDPGGFIESPIQEPLPTGGFDVGIGHQFKLLSKLKGSFWTVKLTGTVAPLEYLQSFPYFEGGSLPMVDPAAETLTDFLLHH